MCFLVDDDDDGVLKIKYIQRKSGVIQEGYASANFVSSLFLLFILILNRDK